MNTERKRYIPDQFRDQVRISGDYHTNKRILKDAEQGHKMRPCCANKSSHSRSNSPDLDVQQNIQLPVKQI